MPGPKYERVQRDDPDRANSSLAVQNAYRNGHSSREKVQIVTTATEHHADSSAIKRDLIYITFITTAVIASYFVLSITLTFYNQWIFKVCINYLRHGIFLILYATNLIVFSPFLEMFDPPLHHFRSTLHW